MSAPAAKAESPKSSVPADRSAALQTSVRATTAFVDNRPAAAAHRQQQALINTSPRLQPAVAGQAQIALSPRQQAAQLQAKARPEPAAQVAPASINNTGLPDALKSGVENLSGYSLDDVQVHYNSDKPAQLQAHAYAQGTDIHVAAGQEQHLPHEAWHVVQQKQGRVKPTRQLKGKVPVNDDAGLEAEADVMGAKALQKSAITSELSTPGAAHAVPVVVQRELAEIDSKNGVLTGHSDKAKASGIKKTKVSFATDKLKTTNETVGVQMEANPLGPDHPQGSAPTLSASAKHIAHFNAKDVYIRGHLLNGHIGGPGKEENLFPITTQANSWHYNLIEKYVEDWVNNRQYYVYYKVTVINRNDKNGEAQLDCVAYPLDAAGKQAATGVKALIHSVPAGSSGKNADVHLAKAGTVDADKVLTNKDVEYQKGKFPIGYAEIEENILALMEHDALNSALDDELSKLGFSETAIEALGIFALTEDDAVFQNNAKGVWNQWVGKLRKAGKYAW